MEKLVNKLPIVKETIKAVAVEPVKMTEADFKAAEFCFYTVGNTYIKNGLFWLPKSQIEIANNYVVSVSNFIKRANEKFFDSPLFTVKDLELVKDYKLKGDFEK